MHLLYRPPKIYLQTQERRQRDALRAAQRQARDGRQRIQNAIDEHGERMSDEGLGLLQGLAEELKKIGEALR